MKASAKGSLFSVYYLYYGLIIGLVSNIPFLLLLAEILVDCITFVPNKSSKLTSFFSIFSFSSFPFELN